VKESFLQSPHGDIGCQQCHAGDPTDPNWQTAHQGIIKDPSFPDPSQACGECHEKISDSAKNSLHYTLKPIQLVLNARSSSANEDMQSSFKKAGEKHCSQCHASCGQCHISRPDYVDGGFIAGHVFQKRPPMDSTCAACHGGRVYAEFTGLNKKFPADIHHKKKNMTCTDCHKAGEMHANADNAATRLELAQRPSCLDCHPDAAGADSQLTYHQKHQGKVACQVCHASPYKNCYSCHVGTDKEGMPYYKCKESKLTLKIGFNPTKENNSSNRYVLVRHPPINPDIFSFYTQSSLPNFDSLPTWKSTAPHTIQRITPQSEACNNCHGKRKLFLGPGDLLDWEKACNLEAVVSDSKIPPEIEASKPNETK